MNLPVWSSSDPILKVCASGSLPGHPAVSLAFAAPPRFAEPGRGILRALGRTAAAKAASERLSDCGGGANVIVVVVAVRDAGTGGTGRGAGAGGVTLRCGTLGGTAIGVGIEGVGAEGTRGVGVEPIIG